MQFIQNRSVKTLFTYRTVFDGVVVIEALVEVSRSVGRKGFATEITANNY